jgi:hypothetical protein
MLQSVDMSEFAAVSKVLTDSISRGDVCYAADFLCIYQFMFRKKPQGNGGD